MASNFHIAYFSALDALIVAEGGTIPTLPVANADEAELAKLDALVEAVGGTVPPEGDDVLKRYGAAIVALGGIVPTAWANYQEAMVKHATALQLARGRSIPATPSAPTNYHQVLLLILEA